MPVWRTIPVETEPQINLEYWTIRELPNGDRHFTGYNFYGREGRVSSKILEFDPQNKRGKTSSGRVYQLDGNTGNHPDAEYVWNIWKEVNSADEYEDVSDSALQESIEE